MRISGLASLAAGIVFGGVMLVGAASTVEVSGPARVVDGDTLEVAAQMVRLHGIDAPETGQDCTGPAGTPWDCGAAATRLLTVSVAGRTVSCVGTEFDRYDRLIATCSTGEDDLGSRMIAEGLAVAYTRFSDDYVPLEALAKKAGKGMWAGSFAEPATFRRDRWNGSAGATPAAGQPEGCPIKGNISGNGRIYHTPWSRWYSRTRIDTSKGERWFCTEAEALAAGWRAPRN